MTRKSGHNEKTVYEKPFLRGCCEMSLFAILSEVKDFISFEILRPLASE